MRKLLLGFYLRAYLVLMSGILGFSTINAQLVINNTVNATDGVQNVLLGPGVVASNVTFNGANEQIGEFICTGCNLGLGNGLVMGSGNVDGAPGPNTSGSSNTTPASGFGASDPDLAELSGFSLNDAAVLQFDFIPTGDSVAFNFVFGSDEYPEFANSSFNDAFGFFLSGPGISGPYLNNAMNIALIPNTTIPVTINNVNYGTTGTGPCEYCQYYVNNINSGSSPITAIECDGFTTVLTAFADVQCGETYHIKLAIADAGDTAYDSYVFLEAGSFSSNQLTVDYTAPSLSPGANMVYEGCEIAYLNFTRPAATTAAQYSVELSGTALNGIDYGTIDPVLNFAANQTIASIPISALDDNISEGNETLTVTLVGVTTCGSADGVTYDLIITDLPPLNVTASDVQIECNESTDLTVNVTGGIGFYTIIWEGTTVGNTYTVQPDVATTYSFVVLDTCGVEPFNGTVDVTFPNYPTISVNIGPDQAITCLEDVSLSSAVSGGYGAYTYQWSANNVNVGAGNTTLVYDQNGPGSIQLTVTDECGATGNDVMNYTIPAVPVSVDLGADLSVTCLDVSSLSPTVIGGVGAYSYQWNIQGGGIIGNAATLDYQTDEDMTIVVTVDDECGNENQDAIELVVPQVAMNIDLGPDQTLTCLDALSLGNNASGGVGDYTYEWSVDGLVASSNDSFNIDTTDDMVISVQVDDECGNSTADALIINVPPVPVNVDAGPDLTVGCMDEATIVGVASGGVGSYSYTWTGNNTNLSLTQDCIISPMADIFVNVVVVDECGNTASDNVYIDVPPVPISIEMSNDTVVCIGQQVVLEALATGGVGALTYAWSPVGSSFNTLAVSPAQSTAYTVSVSDLCGNSAEASASVGVEEVEAGFIVNYIGDFGVELINNSENAATSVWIFSDGSEIESENVSYSFSTFEDWQVTLLVTGSLGCEDQKTEILTPLASIYVPNAFTPDYDGINDAFRAEGHSLRKFHMMIFNRWGEMVFESFDIEQPWDGSHKGADHFVPDGVYHYVILAEGIRGNIIEKEGSIYMVR